MKFNIGMAKYYFSDSSEFEKYKTLGFTLIKCEHGFCLDKDNIEIELNTLNDLIDFTKKYGQVAIDNKEIIIYNGYLE